MDLKKNLNNLLKVSLFMGTVALVKSDMDSMEPTVKIDFNGKRI